MKHTTQEALRAKYPLVFGSCEFRIGEGWVSLMDDLGVKLSPFPVSLNLACSKFAVLRTCISVPPEHRDAVKVIKEDVEAKSRMTCEVCGSPSLIRNVHNSNMLLGLCESCLAVVEQENRHLKRKPK